MLERRTDTGAVPESVLETMFDELVRDHELPPPTRQYKVRAETGSVVARVDFAYPAQHLAIEIDSAQFHAGTEHWRADLARMNVLVALGWRILRFTHRDLADRPADVAHAISDAIESNMRI